MVVIVVAIDPELSEY